VIFISHALEEARLLADRIAVLRDGELVVTGPAGEFDRVRIIQAMVGRSLCPRCTAPPSARRGLTAARC
jgi:ABC-type sugar transport system ATPase subunit